MSETQMAPRSVAVQLPAPSHCTVPGGVTVWPGGVSLIGPILHIPGRTVSDVGHARAHAAAVLAACDLLEAVLESKDG